MSDQSNPCITCGACCARFRVSFYSEEKVPEGYSYVVGPYERALKNRIDAEGRPRCIALRGEIGSYVGCGIYEERPTPCRAFSHGSERCNQARAAAGLAPLNPLNEINLS